MRVILCSDACDIGGAERYLQDLSEDLADRGIDVRIVLADCQRNSALTGLLAERGVTAIDYVPSGIYPRREALSIFYAARRILQLSCPELIHFSLHHADSCRYWILAARSLKIPYVLTEHAVTSRYFHASRLTAVSKRVTYRSAAHIVFVADAGLRQAEDQLGSRTDASIIHPGVDVVTVNNPAATQDVIFMGRLTPDKDPQSSVRAFLEASRDLPQARMLVFGKGRAEREVRDLCSKQGTDRVRLMGWTSTPSANLAKGAILVMTSQWENSPYVVLDAMAWGRTVVAYAVGDIPSMLGFGEAGIPVPPGDFQQLVRSLRRAMTDDDLRRRFAISAPAQVRAKYSRDEMTRRTVDVYQRVTGRDA